MTIDEIFSKMATHMVEGLMIHDQLSQAFCYLGLYGYEKIHLHQYEDESQAYKDIARYYILNKCKTVEVGKVDDPGILKRQWFESYSYDIRPSTRKQIVDECFKLWVDWEHDTKQLYQDLYVKALAIGEVSDAAKIQDYVVEVGEEWVKAKDIWQKLRSVDFDLVAINDEQASVYDLFVNN